MPIDNIPGGPDARPSTDRPRPRPRPVAAEPIYGTLQQSYSESEPNYYAPAEPGYVAPESPGFATPAVPPPNYYTAAAHDHAYAAPAQPFTGAPAPNQHLPNQHLPNQHMPNPYGANPQFAGASFQPGPGPGTEYAPWGRKPRNNLRVVVIALTVAVVLLIVGGVVGMPLLKRFQAEHNRVALPATLAGYSPATSASAQQAAEQMRSMLNGSPGGYAMNSGIYQAADDTHTLLVEVAPIHALGPQSPVDATQEFIRGFGAAPQSMPATGTTIVTCGLRQFGAAPMSACAWANDTSVGFILSVAPALSFTQLESIAAEAFPG